jgi:hypothetical protein
MAAAALARTGVRAGVTQIGLTEISPAAPTPKAGAPRPRCRLDCEQVHSLGTRSNPNHQIARSQIILDLSIFASPIADAEVPSIGGATFDKPPDDDRVVAQVARAVVLLKWRTRCRRRRRCRGLGAATGPAPRRHFGRARAVAARTRARARRTVQADRVPKNAIAEGLRRPTYDLMEGEGSRFYGKTMPSPVPTGRCRRRGRPSALCGDRAVQQSAAGVA